jgi:hypothetical protein
MSEQPVSRYVPLVDQRQDAIAAVIRLDATGTEQKSGKSQKTRS